MAGGVDFYVVRVAVVVVAQLLVVGGFLLL